VTYHFTGVVAWDVLGTSVRIAANKRSVSIIDPATLAIPTGLVQGGVAVAWLTADARGRYTFSCDVAGVSVDFGAGPLVLYADEVPGLAATAAVDAAASANSAAASAALVGAPADSAVAAIFGSAATDSRIVTDGLYPSKSRVPLMLLGYTTGDGTTDDTAGVTNAIAAAVAQNRALYSPPGAVYLVDPLTIASPLTIEGEITLKARTANQSAVLTINAQQNWGRASVHIDGDSKALYGIKGTGIGRSQFGSLEIKNCQIWGIQFNPAGNNNNCQFNRLRVTVNGVKSAQTFTETAETANVLTSTTGYGTFTLSAPLDSKYVVTDAVYFVICAGQAYKVNTLTSTTITVFNLKAAAGVGDTLTVDILIGGGANFPSWGDNGVAAFAAMDVLSNPGVGIHQASLYGHTYNNPIIQGNGIGFACNGSTQQTTFTKPYFELNTIDYVSWSYVDGVMTSPLLDLAGIQNLVGRITGNGGLDPRMIFLKTNLRGLTSDVAPASNPGSRTLLPGMTYGFYRSSGGWAFVINNAAGYAALGAYTILVDLAHANSTTSIGLSITMGTSNGDTLEGVAYGTAYTATMSGRVLLMLVRVGVDWKVSLFRAGPPAGAITAAPVWVGQTAIVGAAAYIAIGVATTADWKLIT